MELQSEHSISWRRHDGTNTILYLCCKVIIDQIVKPQATSWHPLVSERSKTKKLSEFRSDLDPIAESRSQSVDRYIDCMASTLWLSLSDSLCPSNLRERELFALRLSDCGLSRYDMMWSLNIESLSFPQWWPHRIDSYFHHFHRDTVHFIQKKVGSLCLNPLILSLSVYGFTKWFNLQSLGNTEWIDDLFESAVSEKVTTLNFVDALFLMKWLTEWWFLNLSRSFCVHIHWSSLFVTGIRVNFWLNVASQLDALRFIIETPSTTLFHQIEIETISLSQSQIACKSLSSFCILMLSMTAFIMTSLQIQWWSLMLTQCHPVPLTLTLSLSDSHSPTITAFAFHPIHSRFDSVSPSHSPFYTENRYHSFCDKMCIFVFFAVLSVSCVFL